MTFKDLHAWQIGMQLVKKIYNLTEKFPETERYGLTSQLRRASTSILANIAEGFSRASKADKAYKYTIARAECAEVHALLEICTELALISTKEADEIIGLSREAGRSIHGLVKKFSVHSPSPSPSPSVR